MSKLILASSSPRRLELLTSAGLPPDLVVSPDVDEAVIKAEPPLVYVKRIALAKAKVVSEKYPHDTIVACDTIVSLGRRILGKPEDTEHAKAMLTMLSGRRHRVYSTVVVVKAERVRSKTVSTQVQFKRLSTKEIDLHTNSMVWEGKSGGYALQGFSGRFIKKVNGSVSNVIGLPLMETVNLLSTL